MEQELHKEALRHIRVLRAEGEDEVRDLEQELHSMSAGLEQKEEDLLSIQFHVVELQNQLNDQIKLAMSNADAAAKLEERDKLPVAANQKQEELLARMGSLSSQLQEKVTQLSQELDGSRASYRTAVSRLEAERDTLAAELERVRTQAEADIAALRSELRRREAAEDERRAALVQELRAAQADAERTGPRLQDHLQSEERAVRQALAEASRRKVELLSELRAEDLRRGSAGRRLCETDAACVALPADAERTGPELQSRLQSEEQAVSQALAEVGRRKAELLSELCLAAPGPAPGDTRDAAPCRRSAGSAPRDLRRPEDSGRDARGAPALALEDGPPPAGAPRCAAPPSGGDLGPAGPSVLISVELDLGHAVGTLSVAPWRTRSDLDAVVRDFLQRHRVKPKFAAALARYLEEVEMATSSFPAMVQADLADLHNRFC